MKRLFTFKTGDNLKGWADYWGSHPKAKFPVTIEIHSAKSTRSLDQNALSHVWYRTISSQSGDCTIEEVKRECKLTCGVPILRADSEEFRRLYDKVIKTHDYPTKLEMMDLLPVTRIMSVDQMQEYLDQVYRKYSQAGFFLETEVHNRG